MTHVHANPMGVLAVLIRVSLNGREIGDIFIALVCVWVAACVVMGYRSKR